MVAFAWLLALIALPIYGWKVWTWGAHTDFQVYYHMALQALGGRWNEIYDLALAGPTPFRYGPPTIPLFLPFGLFDEQTARFLFWLVQVLCYAGALYYFYLTLSMIDLRRAGRSVAIAFLFSFRFFLDSFTVGQVTGWMLLATCYGAWALEKGRVSAASGAWAFPTVLKVGPGVFYVPWLLGQPLRVWLDVLKGGVLALMGGVVLLGATLFVLDLPPGETVSIRFVRLWAEWVHVMANDASYFDGAHWGTQSLRSSALRLGDAWGIARATSEAAAKGAALFGVLALVGFCFAVRPRSLRGRGLMLSLAVMAYLLFMPQTFKYSMPYLVIPVGFLVIGSLTRFSKVVLVFGGATLAIAGFDVIGADAYFWLLHHSVPFIAMALLTVAVACEAWRLRE